MLEIETTSATVLKTSGVMAARGDIRNKLRRCKVRTAAPTTGLQGASDDVLACMLTCYSVPAVLYDVLLSGF